VVNGEAQEIPPETTVWVFDRCSLGDLSGRVDATARSFPCAKVMRTIAVWRGRRGSETFPLLWAAAESAPSPSRQRS
jgi:hypothetical protein